MQDVTSIQKQIKNAIKTVPNYPKTGIMFRDITSLLLEPDAFRVAVSTLVEHYKSKGIQKVVGTEARGFIFGAPLALALNVGFVLVRKPKKLPREVIVEEYDLEYGTDCLEMHVDAISKGEKVLIVDDLLATGGTVSAAVNLIRRAGGDVEDAAFIIELSELGGKEKLAKFGIDSFSLVSFTEDER